MPANLYQTHTRTKAHLKFGCHPGHLFPSHRPDVTGKIVKGRGSPYNERYTTPPNLILQQMAQCNLWPWQIVVLVKPFSTIQKSGRSRRMRFGGIEKCGGRIQRRERQITWDGVAEKFSWIKANDRCKSRVRVLNAEPRVKLDRFEGDQQSERLWVKLEWVKTHERDVKKHERPIKFNIRIATRSTKWDEDNEQENNSKLDDNCERCPLIICHLWCRWQSKWMSFN